MWQFPELSQNIRLGIPTAAFGLSDSHKYLTAALAKTSFVYIAADAVTAARAHAAISTLSGLKVELLTAKDEVLTYKDAISKDALFRRIAAVDGILKGNYRIVCDVEAALQLMPSRLPSLTIKADSEYDYINLPKVLVSMGYTREYSAESPGSFAIRGDVLDIYPVGADNPVRIDFFGDVAERIRPYDAISGERLADIKEITFLSACDCFITKEECAGVCAAIRNSLKKFPDSKSYNRAKTIADDFISKAELEVPFTGASFAIPLMGSSCSLFDVLPKDTVLYYDECKAINDKLDAVCKEHSERFSSLFKGGECFDFSIKQQLSAEEFVSKTSSFKGVALQTFLTDTRFFHPLKTLNMRSTPSPVYYNAVSTLIVDLKNWLKNGYRAIIFTDGTQRAEKLKQALYDEYLPVYDMPDRLEALRGIAVSSMPLSKGIVLHECKLAIIGSGDLYVKSPVKQRVRRRRGDLFTAPEVGDYAVHEKHGIGKITGVKKIETTDGIKEYVSLEYKGGDVLYVPVEQMDVLSKYTGGDTPALSKIGGAEFERVKERVRQSLKSLAFDLKALYAERAQKHGFAFPENKVMMSEFENAFPYEETPDQLASIEEIKKDMCSEKVMDRLLCGDVGYGKTEVALRAIYLCVLGGKQAALMCPSTVLSDQHFNVACERFREFGLRIDKLNRFRTPKQQEQTLKQLADGNIDLIIGTHRLLSDDVKFYDLGLLVLDEEQRFGVEHKEKIKNIKKDVDCLTMTATPIPRTLHMSLAGIRDISTINTAPSSRLPVQTYVVEETETLIRDACIREISRGGQVFILYNRVETISTFAGKIAEIVPEGKICYAHGRMDRQTLESSVDAFYKGEKNILVTTTIIENGIDLPNANTIIVIDSDRLGVSQLYQLRGRVGRGTRLAQAYFTFKPSKILTSDAAERLKAIMQFTELGSGYKIAMRDLEIRGAGNVLGAEQHGHMDKVGYELYSKMLKEELTGESSFTAELDIKATAYLPEKYIESGAGRMDCYKQIAEIRSVADYKRVYTSIEEVYGAIPQEVLNLLFIALLKSYAAKFNVKKICVNQNGGTLELPSINALQDGRLYKAMEKYRGVVTLSMLKAPLIEFKAAATPDKTMEIMIKFLKYALSFA